MIRYILFLILVTYPIFSISVIMRTDDSNYTLDDTIGVELIIKADSSAELSGFPEGKNLVITGRPSHSTMQSIQIINGKRSASYVTTYHINYLPEKKGWATLNPVYVTVNGKRYSSNSLKFKIGGESVGKDIVETFNFPFDKEIFVAAKTDKLEAYVGEQVKITYQIYHRVNVDFAERPETPSFKDFWIEDMTSHINERRKRKVFKGYYFNIVPFMKVALFPIKPGKYVLPAIKTKFKSDIFSFSGSNRVYRRTSNNVRLTVKPLPEKGKPKDFISDNVGDYKFNFSISKKNIKVGEPITVKMVVKGRGNLRNIALPNLSSLNGSFKVYDPIEKINVQNDGYVIRGEKIVTIALKALKPGKFTLKGLKFSFFNPKTEKYEEIDYSNVEINVTGKAIIDSNISNSNNINESNNTIKVSLKPLKEELDISKNNNKFILFLLFALLILFPLIYITIIIVQRSKNQYLENYTGILSKKAFKKATTRLNTIDNKLSIKKLYTELYSIIVDYLEEKFSISIAGLTIDQISMFLEKKDVKKETISKIAKELENCEFIKYSNMKIDDYEKESSIRAINEILIKVERGE